VCVWVCVCVCACVRALARARVCVGAFMRKCNIYTWFHCTSRRMCVCGCVCVWVEICALRCRGPTVFVCACVCVCVCVCGVCMRESTICVYKQVYYIFMWIHHKSWLVCLCACMCARAHVCAYVCECALTQVYSIYINSPQEQTGRNHEHAIPLPRLYVWKREKKKNETKIAHMCDKSHVRKYF